MANQPQHHESDVPPEDDGDFEVTVQMIVETLAHEFPEFVMIMAEDEKVKANRVALVGKARQLFLSVADVSLLSV